MTGEIAHSEGVGAWTEGWGGGPLQVWGVVGVALEGFPLHGLD